MTVYHLGQQGLSNSTAFEVREISAEACLNALQKWAPPSPFTVRSMSTSESHHCHCSLHPQDVCWANICTCDRHLCKGGTQC